MQGIIDGNIGGLYAVSLTLNPASVATITTAEQDFTVPGVHVGDMLVKFSAEAVTAGLGIVNYRVKAANTISVTFVNPTAAAIDAPAATYRMLFARLESDLLGGLTS